MKKIFNFKTNYFFSFMPRVLGTIIAIIGFIGLFTRGIETFILILLGIGIIFTRFGVLIDIENKRFKEYLSIFWLKKGKWESLEEFPDLTVLEIRVKSTAYSRSNVEFSSRSMVYRVTLLSENHHQKILLKELREKEKAHQLAEEIAKEINLNKVQYSPE